MQSQNELQEPSYSVYAYDVTQTKMAALHCFQTSTAQTSVPFL